MSLDAGNMLGRRIHDAPRHQSALHVVNTLVSSSRPGWSPVPPSKRSMPLSVSSPRTLRGIRLAAVSAALATLTVVSTATAHDFWLIPDMFGFAGTATVHVNGRSGVKFPEGSAVQPTRVAEARIIGANSTTRITEMTVEGTSLRLHQKPTATGQYLVVAALTARTTRTTPAGLIRYLKAEGGAGEAARLERENAFVGMDSVIYTGASYAATVFELGTGGPRAFSKSAGFPLEFVPVNDPAHVHLGDTLHVKVLGAGEPVPNTSVDATPAFDSTAAVGMSGAVTLTTDASGILHLPLTKAGPWMLRSAFVGRRSGTTTEWDVSRSTYVFNVGTKH